ncbi:DUF305 domain-containing protein [Microvirga sp. 3-52]|uniref:CopM family metallochaperone n=1 Tax=Microvirga sp. 3-52 TaxID=2792425 RepID=UPI001AC99C63|nr:DUF305 domain-containing protein [Microvirga sp. 3-52]MBO1905287.1 DUF305 domain-containing protein [Microvirga sp. 3-52]MBS7452624.1 DUF305 domain-containing protein [Microvirga sp. 3-52]
MKTITKTIAALAITAVAGVAYAQTSHQGHGSMPMSGAMPMGNMDPAAMQKMMQDMMPSPNDPASTKDFKAADMKMMHNMHVPYTGNPDVDFRTHMIPHHQGAVEMAKVALKHAKDPETKRMAQKIIDDQEKEIAEMQDWLKKNGK